MSYVFHPAAEAEHLDTVAYFESKRPGLGASYLAEFEKTMGEVCESPKRYPIERKPDVRHIRMNRFPYTILFAKYQELFKYWQLLIIVDAHSIGWEGSNTVLHPTAHR